MDCYVSPTRDDEELQRVFNYVVCVGGLCLPPAAHPEEPPLQLMAMMRGAVQVSRGINIFDTADSYGTGDLNGRSEQVIVQVCYITHVLVACAYQCVCMRTYEGQGACPPC